MAEASQTRNRKKQPAATRAEISRVFTGIKGFDDMLHGGLPKGRATLVAGTTGAGKTVLLNEFIYRGITGYGENGVFVTFEETPQDIMKNVKSFGWNYASLVQQNKLAFVDAAAADDVLIEMGTDYDFTPLLERIKFAIKRINAKRVAIDSINAFFSRFTNKEALRSILYLINQELKQLGITALISTERLKIGDVLSRYGFEEFVADGVIEMETVKGQNSHLRNMYVRKLRGADYRSGVVQFDIDRKGLQVYPKIPYDPRVAKTSFAVRKKFGIPLFDELLGGGIPQGHTMLLSGNTGTGKTLFGLQFIRQGIVEGENAVFVALEEPVEQVKKTGLQHGWNFRQYEKQGKLAFVHSSLIDINNDKVLHQIIDALNRNNAKRLVFDSISSLLSATMDTEQVRQFLIQLSGFLKLNGITCVMNFLSGSNFGASKGQLLSALETNNMRLSSITDGIVILLFVERGQQVKKMLNVLKMRGSPHSKALYQYDIRTGGIFMGEKYEE